MAISDLPILSALRTKMQWHQERQRVLARVSGHYVGGAQRLLESTGESDQELVTGRVPEAVVHQLESIDVEKEEREAEPLRVAGARHQRAEPVHEQRTIRQSGQGIPTAGGDL